MTKHFTEYECRIEVCKKFATEMISKYPNAFAIKNWDSKKNHEDSSEYNGCYAIGLLSIIFPYFSYSRLIPVVLVIFS